MIISKLFVHGLTLELRESLSLRKTLAEWLSAHKQCNALVRWMPWDFTLDAIFARSRTTTEYLQHLVALTLMRRDFFKTDSPLHHAMDVVFEWAQSTLSRALGSGPYGPSGPYGSYGPHGPYGPYGHRCVYKKNSIQQDIEDARRRVGDRDRALYWRKRKRDVIRDIRVQIHCKRERIREIDRAARDRERIRRRSIVFETSVKLWSDADRVRLAERIERAVETHPKNILKMLNIVDWYIPGTLASAEIDPMQWTTQLCRHVATMIWK